MDLEEIELSEDFRRDLRFLGLSVLIVLAFISVSNLMTSDDPVEVGLVEIETYCAGIDAGGFCLGVEKNTHETYNYDDYESPEEGTENYYRLVEAELMAQAIDICGDEVKGMEWTSEAEFDGKTGEEWLEKENVELLACEETTYRNLEAAE